LPYNALLLGAAGFGGIFSCPGLLSPVYGLLLRCGGMPGQISQAARPASVTEEYSAVGDALYLLPRSNPPLCRLCASLRHFQAAGLRNVNVAVSPCFTMAENVTKPGKDTGLSIFQ